MSNLSDAITLLGMHSKWFNVDSLAGDHNANKRVQIMSTLVGSKVSANVNEATGIAYGVISGNNAHYLMDDIINNGTDLSWEEYKRNAIAAIAAVVADHCGFGVDPEEIAKDTFDACEAGERYECDESEYEWQDSKGNQFRLGYLGGAPLIWCIKTSNVTHARQCSPCVPNAGDLDNLDEDGIECYGVPEEYRDDENA